ncbi:methylated-DNA--[protein]-cysteine S-methyltransferase [Paenibacillus sp. PL2-23]|uniref:methylated-DNA--[protein]-cysteine S-methyltransferase n=1 Tax=Paenibacillus sp. PL2-23 TaxID=2100729 RepID=UPI0030F60C07
MSSHPKRNVLSVSWSMLRHAEWELLIGVTESGLYWIGANGESLEDCRNRQPSMFVNTEWKRNDEMVAPYAAEIAQYLSGERRAFTLRHDLRGTLFQQAVWKALLDIPYGTSVSYSDIAQMISKPSAARAVGAAIGANPVLITVPCHRVVGKNGTLTGYRGGLEMKTRLLELEHEAVAAR